MKQDAVIEIMERFAERTGLCSSAEPRRYLWTDAFAVINFLELHRRTGEERYRELALSLVEQVHRVLGRHRSDDPRSGWLSGLADDAGAEHPTKGGLRIGKPLPERSSEDPPNEQLEWERDGQYFHYLTKWMDALSRTGALLDQSQHHRWAAELARSVLPPFLRKTPSGEPVGLAWKMSVDLSRPLVSGMSPHDALDGYVTYKWLDAAGESGPSLDEDIEQLRQLAEEQQWGTSDPLGLGGLLLDAFKLAQIPELSRGDKGTIDRILRGTAQGLEVFIRGNTLDRPADQRLGFRELGLAIGLQTADRIALAIEDSHVSAGQERGHLTAIQAAAPTGTKVIDFWSQDRNRQSVTWQDHLDINEVMLATALLGAQLGTAVIAGRPTGD